jgi:hypothetical protein
LVQFICSNIPAAPAYGVYISQLIRYYRACGTYQDFRDIGFVLTRKLLNQGFLLVQLKSRFEILTVATMTSLTAMEYLCHNGRRICSTCGKHFPFLSSFMTDHRRPLRFRSETSTELRGTLGSVASLLAQTLYQGNMDI